MTCALGLHASSDSAFSLQTLFDAEIYAALSIYGSVSNVRTVKDRETGQARCVCVSVSVSVCAFVRVFVRWHAFASFCANLALIERDTTLMCVH